MKMTGKRKNRKTGEYHNNNNPVSSTVNGHVDSKDNILGSNRLDLIHEYDESDHNSINSNSAQVDSASEYDNNNDGTESISLHSNNTSTINNKCEKRSQQQQTKLGHRSNNGTTIIMKIKSNDYCQIDLDCKRCTWHLLTGSQRSQRIQMEHKRNSQIAKLIKRKQIRLSNLINYSIMKSYNNNNHDDDDQFDIKDDSVTTKSTNEEPVSSPKSKSIHLHRQQQQQQQEQRLTYYQGYHDVACIILSTLAGSIPIKVNNNKPSTLTNSAINSDVHSLPSEDECSNNVAVDEFAKYCGIDLPACVLHELSLSHFSDCLKSDFWDLQTMLRLSMFPLMKHFDPVVYEHFRQCDMELPYFAIPWVITWFSHEIRDTELVKRIFDFLIVSHPIMSIYVSVAMILHPVNREEILSSEYDFTSLHQILTSLPRNSSMVGWKYRPGDGYVSDDGQDDDDDVDGVRNGGGNGSDKETDDSVSIDADSFVLINEAWASLLNDDAKTSSCEAVSVVSSSLSSIVDTVVPFQELIDMAISYMEKVPPRLLLRLATQQYSCSELLEIIQPLAQHHQFENMPSIEMIAKDPLGVITDVTCRIRMLRPPTWARISKCPSNKMMQQKSREETFDQSKHPDEINDFGTNTLRRRKVPVGGDAKSKQRNGYIRLHFESTSSEGDDDEGLERYLEAKSTLAKIAAGFGSDDDIGKNRMAKQRRKVVIGITIAVVVAAIFVSFVVQQQKSGKQVADGKSDSVFLKLQHDVSTSRVDSRAVDSSSTLVFDIDDSSIDLTQDSLNVNSKLHNVSDSKRHSVESNKISDSTATGIDTKVSVIEKPPESSHIDQIHRSLKKTLADTDSEYAKSIRDVPFKPVSCRATIPSISKKRPNLLSDDESTKLMVRMDNIVTPKPTKNIHSLLHIVALRPLTTFMKSTYRFIHSFHGLNFSKVFQQHLQENYRRSIGYSTSSGDYHGKKSEEGNELSATVADIKSVLIDSPISLGLRDFIKHLTRSKLVKTLAQINQSQIALFVRKALHDSMVQNMEEKEDASQPQLT